MNETGTDLPSRDAPAALGSTVALIGSDGAGKSTVARRVVERLPFPSEYLYMGVNLEASPVMLPTTRLALAIKRRRGGRSDMTVGNGDSATGGGPLTTIRRLVRMINWLAEETYRAAIARRIQRTPAVVVFDRHFFCDYYAGAIAPRPDRRSLDVRIHGYVLDRWYPRPDLALFLDAPTEVLLARKAGTPAYVTQRRAEYLDLARVLPAFQIVDVDRPTEEVVEDVTRRIVAFLNGETDRGPTDPATATSEPIHAGVDPATEAAATALPPADVEASPTDIDTTDEPASRLIPDTRGIVPMDSTSPARS